MIKKLLLFTILSVPILALAQNSIKLWPNGTPSTKNDKNYIEETQYDTMGNIRGYSKISEAVLTVFPAPQEIANGTSVVICPGGGYSHLAINKEGYKVARWLNSLGITAFVLKYRMPSDKVMKNKTIGPLQDVQEAVRMVRAHSDTYTISPDKIGILGFSAGGHLASTLSTHFNDTVYSSSYDVSARPDFSILIYPVVTLKDDYTHQGSKKNLLGEYPSEADIKKFSNELQVSKDTPATFLVHATDDRAVPVENSIQYYHALKDNGVKAELHLYEDGGHGFGLGTQGTHTEWPKACENWLKQHNFIQKKEAYLFSYFKDNGQDGLHLAYSLDGLKWKSLNNDKSFLRPIVGKDSLMRDPCIIRGPKGLFHMVWTVSWTDKGIGYAHSKDLVNWSEQKFIPVMEKFEGTRNTWAPEITYDPKSHEYLIYWASTITGKFPETQSKMDNGYNHRMYYTKTKDFKTFAPTKLFYEPGFNVIDATLQQLEDGYVMFLKDETREPPQKNIRTAFAEKAEGPYSEASAPITGDYWAEGPTAIKIGNRWLVYFDKYRNHNYGAVASKDLKHWEDISDTVSFPKGFRHGTVFKVSESFLLQLQTKK
ncbi:MULTISPECIES: prolyl oligopeptidase family serine peptidase [Flavobacteriaceae]|uniref:prolyl oligopeptidase family serine peptidase n=1 Tax=Flavobacteriaceae TaxID=49546 RepID=UPI001C0E9054|nr:MULTISPECIES: prolyl oligopeptidase family serine peptidase [Allomuricauda]MDC6367624.1 prolyl oligopeptidase family serine peptidase [Muricauda sp. AC10]